MNDLQVSLEATCHLISESQTLTGWVNGDLYTPAGEIIGILPVPDSTRASADIESYHHIQDCKKKHAYLAKQQGTKCAVIAIHTPSERALFKKLMQEDPSFTWDTGKPDWGQCVKVWNRNANGQTIFYKLAEHLQAYYNKWCRYINEKNSVSHAIVKLKALTRKYRNPERSAAAPPVPQSEMPGPMKDIQGGHLEPHVNTVSEFVDYQPIVFEDSSSLNTQPSVPQSSHRVDTASIQQGLSVSASKKSKRKADSVLESDRARKIRTCQKCGKLGCSGSASRLHCKNPCQDCGKMECKGRNSQHPRKDCQTGWNLCHKTLKMG